jgi:hypothetical protein
MKKLVVVLFLVLTGPHLAADDCPLCGAYLEDGMSSECIEIREEVLFHFWRSGETPANFLVWRRDGRDLRVYLPPQSFFDAHRAEAYRVVEDVGAFKAFYERRLREWSIPPSTKSELLPYDPRTQQLTFGSGKFSKAAHRTCYPESIVIGEFDSIPSSFATGAGCTYTGKRRRGQPIFIEDMDGNAVVRLNGVAVALKFEGDQPNGIARYVGGNYEVLKSTKSTASGQESTEEDGYLVVTSKGGGRIRQRIFGACGA